VSETTTMSKIRIARMNDQALWRVGLDEPDGNVIDSTMTAELTEVFRAAATEPRLKAIVLTAQGEDFSFGASVEEHQPASVADMLNGFHGLFRQMAETSVPVLSAVRGKCLGGGMELVTFCQRVFAHPDARFGQPEIKLGVFAPVASAILADRVGRGAADDLLLSGRTIKCPEAHEMRLVDAIEEHPEAAALSWAEKRLLPRSASSLRLATRAARMELMQRFEILLPKLERLYLGELMATRDAVEGIEAFMEKRKPSWSNA